MLMHFHAYVPILFLSFDTKFSACLSLSLLLALACSMAPKRKSTPSQNLLRSGASSSDPTPSHVRFRDKKANGLLTFHDAAFIRNAKSFYRIFLILTFPLSSTVEVRSHCVASWSLASP